MELDMSKLEVVHNPSAKRFELPLDGQLGVLDYVMVGSTMVITHTFVPTQYRGHSLGDKLARAALEYARANGHRVVPQCSFIVAYIRRHPEFQGLTAEIRVFRELCRKVGFDER